MAIKIGKTIHYNNNLSKQKISMIQNGSHLKRLMKIFMKMDNAIFVKRVTKSWYFYSESNDTKFFKSDKSK